MVKRLLESELDILHLHGLWTYTSIAAYRWGQLTGRPVFVSPRGMLDDWALSNAAIKKRLALRFYEKANLAGANLGILVLHLQESALQKQ